MKRLNALIHSTTNFAHRHPLAAPLAAGAIARLIASIVSLGFHARDDYFHVLDPALRWVANPAFDWDHSGLPGAGIRSHLIPRALAALIRGLQAIDITEPDSVLRTIYMAVGAYSLLIIPAMYFTAGRLLSPRGARIATWLAALHLAMPYIGTRLLIEAMAMPPLLLGFGLVASTRFREILAGGLFISLACWFRFQTGVAALGLAGAMAWIAYRRGGWRALAHDVGALALGGGIGVAIQGGYALATTGVFLGPVVKNIAVNLCAAKDDPATSICQWVVSQGLDPHHGLSQSTHFAYLGFWIALTVPPASVVVIPAMISAAKKIPRVSIAFLTFVIIHSLIPHKEERFMLPVLPLFLLLLAAVPDALHESSWTRLKRWWPWARNTLIVVHVLGLLLAVTSQSQLNQRQAMHALRHDTAARGLVSQGPEVPTYFLGNQVIAVHQIGRPDSKWLARTLAQSQMRGATPNRFIAFAPDRAVVEASLESMGLGCDSPVVFEGWWLDRVIYFVNARRNRRRSPVLLWRCELPALAQTFTALPVGG